MLRNPFSNNGLVCLSLPLTVVDARNRDYLILFAPERGQGLPDTLHHLLTLSPGLEHIAHVVVTRVKEQKADMTILQHLSTNYSTRVALMLKIDML